MTDDPRASTGIPPEPVGSLPRPAVLQQAYARYDAADIRRSLSALMALFDRVAMETAERLGFNYPAAAPESAREWVTNCLAEGQG